MQTLLSVRNPVIQAARALQTRKARTESGLFLCEGEHMVGEAAKNVPGDVRTVFVAQESEEKYAALLESLPQATCYAVPESVLQAISQVKTPQGIAATVMLPRTVHPEELGDKVILLENVQDPGNVGTILRTADAAGFQTCILTPGCADPFSPKALRATMGSVFRVPCVQTDDAVQTVRTLKTAGYAVLASVLDGEDFYNRPKLPQKLCIIIGNEGAGITPQTVAEATRRFRLPMRGGAESLNAAVAAAILMYEITMRG